MGAEAPPSFDWCGFCALWYNDKGLRCKINLVDTVLFRYGKLSAWWASNKEGYIQRHTSQLSTLEAIRRRFLAVANEDDSNYSTYVCISRRGDGRPQLLRAQAFNQLCEQLSDSMEAGRPSAVSEGGMPDVMQAFVQPFMDLRYVATFINHGADTSVHTFQRKYSRRYSPLAASASSNVDTCDSDILLASGTGPSAESGAADALEQREGAVDPVLKMQFRKLTVHLVKYIEKAHGLTLAGLVCEFIRDAGGKIYLLSVLRAEWASNSHGHGAGSMAATSLVSDALDVAEPTDADLTPYDDGELTRPPLPTTLHWVNPHTTGQHAGSSWMHLDLPSGGGLGPGSPHSGGGGAGGSGSHYSGVGGAGNITVRSGWSPTGSRPNSATPLNTTRPLSGLYSARSHSPPMGNGGTPRSPLVQYPGSSSRAINGGLALANSWPSQYHEAALSGSPNAPQSPLGRASPPPMGGHGYSSGDRDPSPRGRMLIGTPRERRQWAATRPASSPAGAAGSGLRGVQNQQQQQRGGHDGGGGSAGRLSSAPGARPQPGNQNTGFGRSVPPQPQHNKVAMIERPTSGTGHVNGTARGTPLLMSTLQQEVEVMRDQLMFQHQLAEASAAKVRQLELEKEATVDAFNRRSADLQSQANEARQQLEETDAERARLAEALFNNSARADDYEARNAALIATLETERGTVLAAMRDFQERDTSTRAEHRHLEQEVLRMSERLQEEHMAVAALKRQLAEYADVAARYHKNRGRDSGLEAGMEEVLTRIQPLFTGQANPEGEQYAVQKVLYHHHADLRAVFLYYAQLEKDFTKHWPPRMTHVQWMLFCRDSETSDPRQGSRMRSAISNVMITPATCEDIFKAYSQPDVDAADPSDLVLTYESFLAGIVHLGHKTRRPEVPFLSEGLREYVLKYLSRAGRVSPAGMKKGQVRMALEGTRKVKADGTKGKVRNPDISRPPIDAMPAAPGPASAVGMAIPLRVVPPPGTLPVAARPASGLAAKLNARADIGGGTAGHTVVSHHPSPPRPVQRAAVPLDDKSPAAIGLELQALGINLNF